MAAPDVLVAEVLSGLRRRLQRGELDAGAAAGAVDDLGVLPIEFFPMLAFRRRVWELRNNFSAADAMFVALAEVLEEPLLTTDQRLAAAARKHLGLEVIVPA